MPASDRMKSLILLFVVTLTAGAIEPLPLMDAVKIGGVEFSTKTPPKGLKVRADLGLVMVSALDGQVVHHTDARA